MCRNPSGHGDVRRLTAVALAVAVFAADRPARATEVSVRHAVPPASQYTCAADALYYVLKHRGDAGADLAALREELAPDSEGVSAARLSEVAAACGVPLRGVRTDFVRLRQCETPCVLHVNGNHFIVFAGFDGDRVVVFDNRFGLVDGSPAWFRKKYVWQGVALVPAGGVGSRWLGLWSGVGMGVLVLGLRARVKTSRAASRPAFTLVELLVVIAILAVLSGLTLAAVQRVRASSARAACGNNLRQIALGLHHYHDAVGALPAGVSYLDGKHPQPFMGWSCRLLPYVEQSGLWGDAERAFAAERRFTKNPPHTGLGTRVGIYACPADDRLREPLVFGSFRVALTSYLGVEGTNQYRSDGVIYLDSRVRLADVTDGTANTLMVGERPPSHDAVYGWWYAGQGLDNDGACDLTLGALERNQGREYGCPIAPHPFGPGRLDDPCAMFHFWGLHPGGSHFAFCDGSVRFLAYSAADVLPALATRAGGETAAVPD